MDGTPDTVCNVISITKVIFTSSVFSCFLFPYTDRNPLIAFFVAFLIATACVLWFFVRKGALLEETKQIIKSMVPTLLGTMLLAAMVGIFISFTTFDPWVAAMATLVIGTRVSWSRAT